MMNKKAHVTGKNDGIDRITSLPNNILTHILSFLSTRNAVQTCILSKGWTNTWTSVPELKFDIKEFGLPKNLKYGAGMYAAREKFATKFELLMRNVLEKRGASCVNRFQLCLDSGVFLPCKVVADYIGDVMKLKPQECSIKLCSMENLNLNNDLIFTCASLIYVELRLQTCKMFVDLELNSVNLPCLKTLKLRGVTMSDDSLKKLLLGCSVLEELALEDFNIKIIEICSNTLKKLVLCTNYPVDRLQISTPNLQYLDISGVHNVRRNRLLNLPSLVDAFIYLRWHGSEKDVTRGLDLIHSLSNVESLRIHLNFPKRKIQMNGISSFPVLKNLKCLTLVSYNFVVSDLPLYFLHYSPVLQELTLNNIYKNCVRDFLDKEAILEEMRLVQREYLKIVRIVGFQNNNGFVDRLINKFVAHVKIIGDFVINDLVNDY